MEAKDAIEQEQLSEETESATGEPRLMDENQAEAGSEVLEREIEFSVRDRIAADLQELHDAFQRLRHGTYGRCDTCGAAIPDARLAAVPATRFCLEHERLWELHTMSTSSPDGSYPDGAPSAESVAEQEAIRHFEFVADDDQLEEVPELAAEEAALHETKES